MRIRSQDIGASVKRYDLQQLQGGVLYVATTGDDSSDGKAVSRAKLTIQAAITAADPWSTIFVADGTFTENPIIPSTKTGISLIGVSQFATIIAGIPDLTGAASRLLRIYATHVTIANLTLESFGNLVGEDFGICVNIEPSAVHATVRNCIFTSRSTSTATFATGIASDGDADYLTLASCSIASASNIRAGAFLNGGYADIHDNVFILGADSEAFLLDTGPSNLIHSNTFTGITWSARLDFSASLTSVYANNLTGPVVDNGTSNHWYENWYSNDADLDTDFDGIRNTPWSIGGAAANTDYQPLTFRDGWNQESLGMH